MAHLQVIYGDLAFEIFQEGWIICQFATLNYQKIWDLTKNWRGYGKTMKHDNQVWSTDIANA